MTPLEKQLASFSAAGPTTGFVSVISGNKRYEAVALME